MGTGGCCLGAGTGGRSGSVHSWGCSGSVDARGRSGSADARGRSVSSWKGAGSGVDSVSSWTGAGSVLAADGCGLRTEAVLGRVGWSEHLAGYVEGPTIFKNQSAVSIIQNPSIQKCPWFHHVIQID